MSDTSRRQIAMEAAELARRAERYANGARVSHVSPARELHGFELGDDRVDIRQWPVYASDGRLAGAIDRLFVESATGRIRYASVALAYHAESDDRPTAPGSVLVPIGLIRRTGDCQMVIVASLSSDRLARAPRLHWRPVSRADEDATLTAYGLPTSRDLINNSVYSAQHFDDTEAMRPLP